MQDYILAPDQCVRLAPFAGVRMAAMEGQHMTLSVVELEPHAVIPEHSHPHEQIGYMLEGEAEFVVAGTTYHVRAGQMWRLPGGTPHQVRTGDQRMRAIDVFYPVREDMRASQAAL